MSDKAHRELSFDRDYSLEIGDYIDTSGLLKEELYSWRLCADDKTYAIESAKENDKQSQYIESRHMVVFSYNSNSLISKEGYFYDKFNCENYDWVEQIYKSDYYICRNRK